MSWTDKKIELLKTMWQAGCTASEIADALKGEFSRSAVLGKLRRINATARTKGHAGPKRFAPKPAIVRERYAPPKTRGALALKPDPVDEPVELLDIPIEQRKTLLQLKEGDCRWPVGDPSSPDFYFCGGDAVKGESYCAYHFRVAHQPAQDRRRHSNLKHRF